VALLRTDVSKERIASVIKVKRIIELGTTVAVTSNVAPGSLFSFHPDDGGDTFVRNLNS
jgi:hypothetical protein